MLLVCGPTVLSQAHYHRQLRAETFSLRPLQWPSEILSFLLYFSYPVKTLMGQV